MTDRLTDKYADALVYAYKIHDGQVRKGPAGIPYISHPLAVSSLILEAGGNQDEAIAGLLHDAAEDTGGEARLAEISELFGPTVAEIVRGCSDSLVDDPQHKAPWRERKEAHLSHLEGASSAVLIVTAADKLHNARALLEDLAADPLYLRHFNAQDLEILWYYESMLEALIRNGAPAILTDALMRTVSSLACLIRVSAGERVLETPIGNWIRGADGLFRAEDVVTIDYAVWRDLQSPEPLVGESGAPQWTVRAADVILEQVVTAQAWTWCSAERWQVEIHDSYGARPLVSFRSDGSWVEIDGRHGQWSSVLEGGPQAVADSLVRRAFPDRSSGVRTQPGPRPIR